MKVGVVYSESTAEAEISQRSAKAIAESLSQMNYSVATIPFTQNFIEDVRAEKVDLIFNAMHGKFGEDGYVQTILNAMQIPYTHSGVVASQIGINKILTNIYAQMLNIPTIQSVVVSKQNLIDGNYFVGVKSFIKPVNGGSSVATFLIQAGEKLNANQIDEVINFHDGNMFMIEECFSGIETGIAILENKALGSFQIIPAEEFYSYNAKYNSNETQYIVPANISKSIEEKLILDAEKIHNGIGAWCISRVDFLVNNNDYRLLEINTHPGFTNSSLVPKVAKRKGMEFADVVQKLIDCAKFEAI